MTNELWVPESHRAAEASRRIEVWPEVRHDDIRKAAADALKAQGQIRSILLPGSAAANLGGMPTGMGSPYMRRPELTGLWRRSTWIRAGIRRLCLIAISEGWEFAQSTAKFDSSTAESEYEYLQTLFEPEIDEVTNIRQSHLPRQKMLVTLYKLKMYGESYWELVPNGFGDVIDWQPVHGQVIPNVDERGYFRDIGEAYYQVNGNLRQPFAWNELLRFEIPDIDGRLGVSEMEALELPVTTDIWAQSWNRNSFKNNRVPPGSWVFDPATGSEDMRTNRESIDQMYSGVENANKPAIVVKGQVQYTPHGTPFGRDQEFLKGRTYNRDEIFALIGVSAGLLGIIKDVNRSNLEGLVDIAYKQEVQPLQEIVAETINLWLYSQGIKSWVFRFRPRRADEAVETLNSSRRIESGISTPNQERRRRGETPYPGGNAYYMSKALVPVGADPDDTVGQVPSSIIPTYSVFPELAADQSQPTPGSAANATVVDEEQAVAAGLTADQRNELGRWKKVAMKMASGERMRGEFRSAILPAELISHIRNSLVPVQDSPEAIEKFFEGLVR